MKKLKYKIGEYGDVCAVVDCEFGSPEFTAMLEDEELWNAIFPELPENEPEEWCSQHVTDKLRDLLSFSPNAEENYRRLDELADKYTGGNFPFAVSALRKACFELADGGASDEDLLAAAEATLAGK